MPHDSTPLSQVACLFADAASGELALPDCTQLDAAAMIELVKGFAGPRLERLELGHCGRGFGDEVAAAAVRSGPLAALQVRPVPVCFFRGCPGRASPLSAPLLCRCVQVWLFIVSP